MKTRSDLYLHRPQNEAQLRILTGESFNAKIISFAPNRQFSVDLPA